MDLLSNPYVMWGVVALAALVLYQRFAPRLRIRVPGTGGMSTEALKSKLLGSRYAESKLQRAVEREKKQGSYLMAGKLLEDAGKLPGAVEVYLEGQEYFAAGTVLERLGQLDRAAELYLEAGDYKKSAQIFVSAGKPARAAQLFLEKGNTLEAARLYGMASVWDKAGELYAKAGYPLRAAEAFEKKGEYLKAAECYERHFMENVTYSTTYSSTAATADQKSALLAGKLYEKAGDVARAREVYLKGGYFADAAKASLTLGQFVKAAELFMRAEDPESAAAAFDRAGDPVQAANLRGEVALKTDRAAEAAAHFVQGKDFLRAAELYESVGMLAEAAGAYEAGESYAAAGSVYIRAGLKERAAASYERSGDFETAAKLYEEAGQGAKAIELYGRAGQTFKSGEAAAKAGEREKAIALLQRVGPSDDNYRTATELLARLFIEGQMPALAIERVQRVLGSEPVSAANLDLHYWLAAAHEASGHNDEALVIYKRILAEDLQYRDVERRVARITSGAPYAPPQPPARYASPPAAAAPAAEPRSTPRAPSSALPPVRPASPDPAPASPAPAKPAPRGPRFVPKGELGRGPLGTVFRAEDQVDGRSVALRVLPPQLIQDAGLFQGLVSDLKAAAQLSHPNLVKVLGLVDLGGQRAVVTEYVQGRTFAEALNLGHKMNFQQAHSMGRVVAQVLAFLHGKGFVHGSIQPSNLMVASGVVKVADLGLGRLAHGLKAADNYHAPETQLDVADDLYSLAAVLYHLMTAVHPKSQPQGVGLPLPSTLAPGVPEVFDKLLLRCLHPRRELRVQTADELLRELKDMVRIG
jgi:serine/threonine-protein kinase